MFKDDGAAAAKSYWTENDAPNRLVRRPRSRRPAAASLISVDYKMKWKSSRRVEIRLPHRGNRILLAQPVMPIGKREDALPSRGWHAMSSQLLKLYGGIFALVLRRLRFFSAFLLSSQFLRFVTNPILSLAAIARDDRPSP